jgi:hypothetical protein
MIPRRLQLPKIVPKAKENAAHFFYGGVEQFNGREGETATFLSRCLFTLSLSLAVSPHVISAVGRLYLERL